MKWQNYTSLPDQYRNQRVFDGCGISGFINVNGDRISGEKVVDMLCILKERENGLGAGYAGYGIYPEYKDYYAFHFLFDNAALSAGEKLKIKIQADVDITGSSNTFVTVVYEADWSTRYTQASGIITS